MKAPTVYSKRVTSNEFTLPIEKSTICVIDFLAST